MKRIVIIVLFFIAFRVNGQENLFDNHKRSIGFFFQNNYSIAVRDYYKRNNYSLTVSGIYTFGTGFEYSFRYNDFISIETGLQYVEFGYKENEHWVYGSYPSKTHGNLLESRTDFAVGFLAIPCIGKIYFPLKNWKIAIIAGIALNNVSGIRELNRYRFSDGYEVKYFDYEFGPSILIEKNILYAFKEYTFGSLSIGYSIERKISDRWFFNIEPEYQVIPIFRFGGEKTNGSINNYGLKTGIRYILK